MNEKMQISKLTNLGSWKVHVIGHNVSGLKFGSVSPFCVKKSLNPTIKMLTKLFLLLFKKIWCRPWVFNNEWLLYSAERFSLCIKNPMSKSFKDLTVTTTMKYMKFNT